MISSGISCGLLFAGIGAPGNAPACDLDPDEARANPVAAVHDN